MTGPGSGPTLPSALGLLLAEVRAGSEGHRRNRAHHSDTEPPPWSDADEDVLSAFDLRWLGAYGEELDQVRSRLREVGAELGRLAQEAVGDAATTVCARLAASTHGRADTADALVGEIRGAGGRVDALLDGVARRVLRTLDGGDSPLWAAAPEADDRPPWAGSPGDPPSRYPTPPHPPSRYPMLLRTLREAIAEALGALPELLDRPDPPSLSDRGTPGSGWIPAPGTGPLLPGIEARRIEPGYGVRIARLPDYRTPG